MKKNPMKKLGPREKKNRSKVLEAKQFARKLRNKKFSNPSGVQKPH